MRLPFSNYTQTPDCEFSVNYVMTLVEKPFGSPEEPAFDPIFEGTLSDPEFVTLDLDGQFLQYQPFDDRLLDRSFAVYIKGYLAVNSTIQSPMVALNQEEDYFDVSIEPKSNSIQNTAPFIRNAVKKLSVYSGESKSYSVGQPIDMQLD